MQWQLPHLTNDPTGRDRPTHNIGIIHVFSCEICRVPRELLEHKAAMPSVQMSFEGPGKY